MASAPIYFYYTYHNRFAGVFVSVVTCDRDGLLWRASYMRHATRDKAYRYARSMAHDLAKANTPAGFVMTKRDYQRGP